MRKTKWILFVLLCTTPWLMAQKVTVGEYVNESYETSHPYDKSHIVPGELDIVQTDTIAFPGATYIALHFAWFELAEGDIVIVRSPDHSQSYVYKDHGRSGLGVTENGFFATHIKGDTAIVELYSDNHKESFGYLIDFYGRGYNEKEIQHYWDIGLGEEMNLPRPKNDTRSICTTDDTQEVKCYETSEPAAYDKARAVCRLMLNGAAHCTGWLIGSEGHIMTNEHCIGSQSQLNSIDFEFMAEGADCATNCASSLACPGTIEASGGTLINVNATYDYALVMPDTSVGGGTDLPSTYGYMQLRPTGAVVGERLYIAQHPAGWGKRLAMESSYPGDPDGLARVYSIDEAACSGGASDVDVGYWADTQGGSSGSPVLGYSDNLIIALHHCRGSASCTTGNPSSDDPNRGVPIQDVIAALGSDLPNGATCDPPDAPTGVTAVANGDNNIDVSWNAVTGADSYIVYRAQGACGTAAFEEIADGVVGTTYSDGTVSGDITYSYQVKAFIDSTTCEGPFSNCDDAMATGVCTLPPLFDGLVSAENAYINTCEIVLEWNDATAQCGSSVTYNVYRSETQGFTPGPANLISSCVGALTYSDFDIEPGTLYYYIVRAEDGSGNGSGPCGAGNEDTNMVELDAFASGPNATMFFDDVESGNPNFTTTSGSSTGANEKWVIVDPTHPLGDGHYNSPTHSWFCSGQPFVKDERLETTSAISIPDQLGTIIRWYQEVEMEDEWDGGVFEYSIDGTTWFDILDGNGGTIPADPDRFLSNGYNVTLRSANALGARPGWSGDLGGYHEVQVDLSDFANMDVYFRWRAGCDTSQNDDGWWIDDIEVLYPTDCSGVSTALSVSSLSATYGDAIGVDVSQLNGSGFDFGTYGFDVTWDSSKIEYTGFTADSVASCDTFNINFVQPGLAVVSANCSTATTPGTLFTLEFDVVGLTGYSDVNLSVFTGDLSGAPAATGTVTLPVSVDPCTMPSSLFNTHWNMPVTEPDLDMDEDNVISIMDRLHHMQCPPVE